MFIKNLAITILLLIAPTSLTLGIIYLNGTLPTDDITGQIIAIVFGAWITLVELVLLATLPNKDK